MNEDYTYTTSDADYILVKKYLEGDSTAFTPLFNKYKPIFFSNLIKWYGQNSYNDYEEIQDMSMEFLGRIASKLHMYDPKKSTVGTWITNSMRNFMIEYYKRNNSQKRIPSQKKIYFDEIPHFEPSDNDIYKNLEIKSHRKLIKKMLESLGHDDTKIFNDIFIKGKTQAEVARELGIGASTLEYRVRRVKKRLEKFKPKDF